MLTWNKSSVTTGVLEKSHNVSIIIFLQKYVILNKKQEQNGFNARYLAYDLIVITNEPLGMGT